MAGGGRPPVVNGVYEHHSVGFGHLAVEFALALAAEVVFKHTAAASMANAGEAACAGPKAIVMEMHRVHDNALDCCGAVNGSLPETGRVAVLATAAKCDQHRCPRGG